MAGGIFVEQPFYANPKCVVFALLIIVGWWWAPKRNIYLIPLIFVAAYVLLAWYDYLYDCKQIMRSGWMIGPNTFDAIFKPQRRIEENPSNISPDQEEEYLRRVYLFHLLAVAPILGYIGLKGSKADERIFPVALGMAFLAALYHGTRLVIPREK